MSRFWLWIAILLLLGFLVMFFGPALVMILSGGGHPT